MRAAFIVVIVAHGLLHLLGAAKGFGIGDLPQLTTPIGRGMGLLWLLAAVLMLASVVGFLTAPSWFWLVGAMAIVISQLAILTAWRDARFGTIANGLLLIGVVYSFLAAGPGSLRREYRSAIREGLARPTGTRLVREEELAPLPAPVQRYLRRVGAVGQPHVVNYRLRFRGRIRSGPSAPWMPFTADQQSFVAPPARLFFLHASMKHLPVDVFHDLVDGHARMRVRVAGVVSRVEASGAIMDRSEAVTLLNDLCFLAPPALLDSALRWEAMDERSARAHFTSGTQTISATLRFDAADHLVDFVSDDRSQLSADGKRFTQLRFTTPATDYRRFGPYLLAARAEAHWHPQSGEFSYGEFELVEAQFNVGAP